MFFSDLSDNPDVSSTGLLDKGSANGSNSGINMSGGLTADSLGISSIETLLRNIQGLLKVAADNARQQERQSNYEKGKLTFPTVFFFEVPVSPLL